MAELDLTNVFNDCIDRISDGQSIEDCLRRYPQYAAALRPMLEAGLLVQRIHADLTEVLAAQARVRRRFDDALRAPIYRRTSSIRQLAYALAAIFIIGFVSLGSLTAVSQNSLPGDALYGLKRLNEGVQRSLFDNDSLETTFDQRRIQEIRQLLALGRVEDVSFSGKVTSKNDLSWTIASLSVAVTPDMPNFATIQMGDEVDVTARTTAQHTLVAITINVTESANTPLPTPLASTLVPTSIISTITPAVTAAAAVTATASPTLTPSVTSHPTSTPIPVTIVTNTATPPAPTLANTAVTPTICIPTRPDGWVNYRIQAGDTLSALASGQSISLTELMTVNCITEASRIIIGETIFLPEIPVKPAPTTANSSPQNSGSNESSSGNTGNSDSNDDHGGSSNSGHGSSGSGGSDDGSGHN